jgi:PTS system mannose-specific IIB component
LSVAVVLARVDNRLVHGQILEAWLPALDARQIVVADDEAAQNQLLRSAMAIAIPPDVAFAVVRVEGAALAISERQRRTLVLLRDVSDAERAFEHGLRFPLLNVGNVHFAKGRRPITPSVYLSAAELDTLGRLEKKGARVEVRSVPDEPARGLEEVRREFEAAASPEAPG